jgi:glutamine phosphoribosylpyrophosphate amidotransferase
MPIPDSSRPAAMQWRKLRIQYREGFYKNRYIGRVHHAGQAERKKSVKQSQRHGIRVPIEGHP